METEEKAGPGRMFLLSLGLLGILLGGLVAAELAVPLQPGIGGGPVPVQEGVASILMPENAATVNFSPSNATIILGSNGTVQWTNQDTVPHTVVVCPVGSHQECPTSTALAASKILMKGDTFKVKFNDTGTYLFYCSIHPLTMKGYITVEGGGPTIVIPSGTAAETLNYSPSKFTVVVGLNNTVTFVNQDSTTHTVTADDGSFISGDIAPGKTWTHTFTTTGTFGYHCVYHSFMTGTITVKPAP
jgi:plastocyanin